MSSTPALEALSHAARSLTRGRDLESTLLGVLRPLEDQLGMASAAVFVVTGPGPALEIAGAIGLGDPAALAAAVRNPAHPVTRTVIERAVAFDVRPTAPGGPALRSHLPLIVGDGDGEVIGVLAVAHDAPLDADAQLALTAVADLAALAIERERTAGPAGRAGRQP